MKRLSVSLGILLIALSGLVLLNGCTGSDHKPNARKKLDNLLGSNHGLSEPHQVQPQSQKSAIDRMFPLEGMGGLFSKPLEMAFAQPDIQVHETPEQIEVQIPLERPEDEKNIEVQVKPNGVQVSGRFTSGNGEGFTSSTTFMRFFSSSDPLDPEHVKRHVTRDMLVVKIPKLDHVGDLEPFNPEAAPDTADKTLPPEVLEQLQQSRQRAI